MQYGTGSYSQCGIVDRASGASAASTSCRVRSSAAAGCSKRDGRFRAGRQQTKVPASRQCSDSACELFAGRSRSVNYRPVCVLQDFFAGKHIKLFRF
uniref:Uncharacterized protein n=1 Tax=Syphacia muris TaxID=451379 RepID=A0A0N5AQ54_9BILA